MPEFATFQLARLTESIRAYVETPRFLCVRRPILVHAPSDEGKACYCCGSEHAKITEKHEHLDVLIDRIKGTRSVLQKLKDPDKIKRWHEIAETAKQIHSPARCTPQQYPILLDDQSKVIYAFGGNQSGKTTMGGEFLWDRCLAKGGKGAKALWCAPDREKTQVGVDKLVRGVKADRFVPPIIPPELVVSYPKDEHASDQVIRLVDGTGIDLRYCSRRGGNLKGVVSFANVLDEGTEVNHEINHTILVNRLLMTRGQMIVPTTPKKDHWLQAKDRECPTYAEVEARRAHGEDADAVKVVLSCRDNPWMPPGEVERTIRSLGGEDDPRVKREVLGLWVAEGTRLWRHFLPSKHTVEWTHRDVSRYGWQNVTPAIVREAFYGMTEQRDAQIIAGADFNYNPFSVAVCRIICRQDEDPRDPKNLVLYVEDCVLKRSNSTHDFAEWLGKQAGSWRGRGLKPSHFGGMHVVCDATGFYTVHDRRVHLSNDAEILRQNGFVVRASRYVGGSAVNPPRRVRIGFVNELLKDGRLLINAQRGQDIIDALENEIDDGTGDTKKTPGSAADRMSGITDALGYLAYAALYTREGVSPGNDENVVTFKVAGAW